MTDALFPSCSGEIDAAAAPAGSAAARLAMLRELAEIGMDLARALHREVLGRAASLDAAPGSDAATTPAPAAVQPDYGLTYSRIARAVRLTLALAERMEAPPPARARAAQGGCDDAPGEVSLAEVEAARRRLAPRRPVLAAVRAGLDGEGLDRESVLALLGEARERIEEAEAEGDGEARPLAELVGWVCRALELGPEATARALAACEAAPSCEGARGAGGWRAEARGLAGARAPQPEAVESG